MIHKNKSHFGTKDADDVYVDEDCGAILLWRYDEDSDAFDMVQLSSEKDVDRLIEILTELKNGNVFGREEA